MISSEISRSMGWIPDYRDVRDYTPEHPEALSLAMKLRLGSPTGATAPLPTSADLRAWCTPIEDQGALGACTAHAAAGLVEYNEKKAFSKYTDASRLFIYKATRDLMGLKGDTGASIRSTLGTLVLFGAPPEKYWPYDVSKVDDEPPAFCYSLGASYHTLKYVRLDAGVTPDELLVRIKTYLAAKIPSMFGFSVYKSISQGNTTGKIPFPTPKDTLVGGHAIVAVGYDDAQGALLIRNSWGPAWGDNGYGWLPYEYVLKGLASDWWTITKAEWLDTEQFGV